MCEVEVSATDAWLKDGAALEHESASTDKTALAAALERRAEAVSKIISQLRGVRAQLQGHTHRVNEVFTTMHTAMRDEVSHNAQSLDNLGVAFGSWGVFKNPSSNPIEVGKVHSGVGEATALLEVAVSVAKEDAASDAHVGTLDAVFENFKRAISMWEPINTDFEHERTVLDALDKEIERVLISKQAKLRHLTDQAAELRSQASATSKEPALGEAMQAVTQHRTIIARACEEAKRHARSASQLKQQIVSFMNGSTKMATGAGAPASDDGVALPPIEIPGPAASAKADEAEDVVSQSGRRLQFKQAHHIAANAKDLLAQVLNEPLAAAGKALR